MRRHRLLLLLVVVLALPCGLTWLSGLRAAHAESRFSTGDYALLIAAYDADEDGVPDASEVWTFSVVDTSPFAGVDSYHLVTSFSSLPSRRYQGLGHRLDSFESWHSQDDLRCLMQTLRFAGGVEVTLTYDHEGYPGYLGSVGDRWTTSVTVEPSPQTLGEPWTDVYECRVDGTEMVSVGSASILCNKVVWDLVETTEADYDRGLPFDGAIVEWWPTDRFSLVPLRLVDRRHWDGTETRGIFCHEPPFSPGLEPPTVMTVEVRELTCTSVTLVGYLEELGTADTGSVWFEWGVTSSYGNQTIPQEVTSVTEFSAALARLFPGTQYHFRAVAAGDCVSYGADKVFTTVASPPPAKPTNLSPPSGLTTGLVPELAASTFFDPDGDRHIASQWQIRSKEGDYAAPVYEYVDHEPDLTSIAIPLGVLEPGSVYYWRVRYQDQWGTWSPWSDETWFRTCGSGRGMVNCGDSVVYDVSYENSLPYEEQVTWTMYVTDVGIELEGSICYADSYLLSEVPKRYVEYCPGSGDEAPSDCQYIPVEIRAWKEWRDEASMQLIREEIGFYHQFFGNYTTNVNYAYTGEPGYPMAVGDTWSYVRGVSCDPSYVTGPFEDYFDVNVVSVETVDVPLKDGSGTLAVPCFRVEHTMTGTTCSWRNFTQPVVNHIEWWATDGSFPGPVKYVDASSFYGPDQGLDPIEDSNAIIPAALPPVPEPPAIALVGLALLVALVSFISREIRVRKLWPSRGILR